VNQAGFVLSATFTKNHESVNVSTQTLFRTIYQHLQRYQLASGILSNHARPVPPMGIDGNLCDHSGCVVALCPLLSLAQALSLAIQRFAVRAPAAGVGL